MIDKIFDNRRIIVGVALVLSALYAFGFDTFPLLQENTRYFVLGGALLGLLVVVYQPPPGQKLSDEPPPHKQAPPPLQKPPITFAEIEKRQSKPKDVFDEFEEELKHG